MVRVLTDSSTGFTLEDTKKFGIEMLCMPITFEDGETFLDVAEISHEEFYKKLDVCKDLPKTSLVSQARFEEVFEDVKKKGDEMVVLVMSKGLSSTLQNAINAKNAVGYDKIYVVDTLATVASLIALTLEAVKMKNSGESGQAIAEKIEELVPKVRLYAYVSTMKYLRAGGRISAAAAVVGTVMHIKPSLCLEGGRLYSRHKFLSVKKAQAHLASQLTEYNFDETKPVYFNHTAAPDECNYVRSLAKKQHPNLIDGGDYFVSSTVGTHLGRGAVAIIFFEK